MAATSLEGLTTHLPPAGSDIDLITVSRHDATPKYINGCPQAPHPPPQTGEKCNLNKRYRQNQIISIYPTSHFPVKIGKMTINKIDLD